MDNAKKIQQAASLQIKNIKEGAKSIKERAEQQSWGAIKKVRAQIAMWSIKKAMSRVMRQKEQQAVDSVEAEQIFNLKLSREINYQKVATEYGDSNSVTNGVFSAKGNMYITVGSSGQGKIWNTQNAQSQQFCTQISSLKALSKLCGLDIHPRIGIIPASAPNILAGTTNGQLLVSTFAPQLSEQKTIVKEAHGDRINSLKFIQSGTHFLTASYDHSWRLWDARLTPILTQKGHQRQIHACSLHPDQSLLATVDLGGYGMVWDLRTGEGVYQVSQKDALLCCDFHPNGFELAIGGKTNIVSIFDLRRKKQLKRIPAHLKLISDVKYEQNGMLLASASHDNSIRFWHGKDYGPLPSENLTEQHKITSIGLKQGKLTATGIDRKWSMFVRKNHHKQETKEVTKQQQ